MNSNIISKIFIVSILNRHFFYGLFVERFDKFRKNFIKNNILQKKEYNFIDKIDFICYN